MKSDIDRINTIADRLDNDLDRAFLKRVAVALEEKYKACELHIKTHEMTFGIIEELQRRLEE